MNTLSRIALWAACLAPAVAAAHCEIPCGIYGDALRFQLLAEHIDTVEKSMREIEALSKASPRNENQLARWVANKEWHADEIQQIVSQYFMTQRVQPADAKDAEARARYVEQITTLHEMLIAAMKAKQTTDTAHTERLRERLAAFRASYERGSTQSPQRAK